jgi:hypothetical protein
MKSEILVARYYRMMWQKVVRKVMRGGGRHVEDDTSEDTFKTRNRLPLDKQTESPLPHFNKTSTTQHTTSIPRSNPGRNALLDFFFPSRVLHAAIRVLT